MAPMLGGLQAGRQPSCRVLPGLQLVLLPSGLVALLVLLMFFNSSCTGIAENRLQSRHSANVGTCPNLNQLLCFSCMASDPMNLLEHVLYP